MSYYIHFMFFKRLPAIFISIIFNGVSYMQYFKSYMNKRDSTIEKQSSSFMYTDFTNMAESQFTLSLLDEILELRNGLIISGAWKEGMKDI